MDGVLQMSDADQVRLLRCRVRWRRAAGRRSRRWSPGGRRGLRRRRPGYAIR